jgi:putative hydrolase of the HAD superfamily
MRSSKIKTLLFDVGGVVIDFDFMRAFEVWKPISHLSCAEMESAFKFDAAYEQHERGEITAQEYFSHLATSLELQQGHTRIAEGWNAIFVAEISETRAMLQAAGNLFSCYALTNTNATHHATWSTMFPMVWSSFERVFASHEMGCRKPEPQAFEYIAQALDVSPDSIMFFDDVLENVEAATRQGLQAVHVRSPEDVRKALRSIGCVP